MAAVASSESLKLCSIWSITAACWARCGVTTPTPSLNRSTSLNGADVPGPRGSRRRRSSPTREATSLASLVGLAAEPIRVDDGCEGLIGVEDRAKPVAPAESRRACRWGRPWGRVREPHTEVGVLCAQVIIVTSPADERDNLLVRPEVNVEHDGPYAAGPGLPFAVMTVEIVDRAHEVLGPLRRLDRVDGRHLLIVTHHRNRGVLSQRCEGHDGVRDIHLRRLIDQHEVEEGLPAPSAELRKLC